MSKYTIILDGELENMLIQGAKNRNISAEQFIVEIIDRYLPPAHIIDREEMAKGYAEMAQINLDIAK